ncbi:hypothetical protein H257_19517, partial [Aphanomyces astaci]
HQTWAEQVTYEISPRTNAAELTRCFSHACTTTSYHMVQYLMWLGTFSATGLPYRDSGNVDDSLSSTALRWRTSLPKFEAILGRKLGDPPK